MSNFLTASQVTGGLNGSAPRIHSCSTADNLATVTTAGYVADQVAKGTMSYLDRVYLNYDVNGTKATGVFTVTATSNGSLVAANVGTGSAGRASLNIKAGITAALGAGAGPTAAVATGVAAGDIVVATILTSTNAVAVSKAVAAANQITFTFTGDPAAGATVQWHAISPTP